MTAQESVSAPASEGSGTNALLFAQFISTSGDYIYMIALSVWVIERTDSPTALAVVILARLIPGLLLGTIAGRLADRADRKNLLVTLDIVRSAFMACLAIVILGEQSLALVVVLVAATSILTAPAGPASIRMLTDLTPVMKRPRMNSLYELAAQVAVFAGPAAAAVLLNQLGTTAAVAANSITFLLSACVLSTLPKTPRAGPAKSPEKRHLAGPARPIAVLLRHSVPFLGIAALAEMVQFGFEQTAFPLFGQQLDALGVGALGWLFAAMGVGGVAAAPIAIRLARISNHRATLAASFLVEGLAITAIAFTTSAPLAIVAAIVAGMASFSFETVLISALQTDVGSDYIGEVYGALGSIAAAGTILGTLIVPLTVGVAGIRGVTLAVLAISLAAALFVVILPWTTVQSVDLSDEGGD